MNNNIIGKIICWIFILIGLVVIALLPVRQLVKYHQTGSWERVEAYVMEAKVKSRIAKAPSNHSAGASGYKYSQHQKDKNKKITMYRPYVEFRYDYQGQQHVATSKTRESSNPEFAETLVARMNYAQATRSAISVYVNPKNPGEALIDRSIPWLVVIIGLIFGSLFVFGPAILLVRFKAD